jgi:peptide/nickel transport system permease protein
MTNYAARRVARAIGLLWGVSAVTFVVFYLLPAGNQAALRAGPGASAARLASVATRLGLDRPFYTSR